MNMPLSMIDCAMATRAVIARNIFNEVVETGDIEGLSRWKIVTLRRTMTLNNPSA